MIQQLKAPQAMFYLYFFGTTSPFLLFNQLSSVHFKPIGFGKLSEQAFSSQVTSALGILLTFLLTLQRTVLVPGETEPNPRHVCSKSGGGQKRDTQGAPWVKGKMKTQKLWSQLSSILFNDVMIWSEAVSVLHNQKIRTAPTTPFSE